MTTESGKISLFEANRPRAQLIAAHCAKRLANPGLWAGYTAAEPLEGELRSANQINYWRRSSPHAVLVFWRPTLTDIKEVDWGEPITLERNVVERYSSTLRIEKAVHYTDTISHTFSKTRSLLEAAKVGAEVAIKAGLEAEYAGVKGSLEVSAKITAEYSRQWGTTEVQSDTVTRNLDVQGPISLDYEAVRSLDKMQRQITSRADFSYSIGLIDETGAGVNPPRIYLVWQSWEEFLAVVNRLAPHYRTVGPQGRERVEETPLYREFMDQPLSAEEITELTKPSDAEVSFLVEYDNVVSQDIKIV